MTPSYKILVMWESHERNSSSSALRHLLQLTFFNDMPFMERPRLSVTVAILCLEPIKVFWYSFFGTIPNFLNRLLDSLHLVGSTWKLHYLLVLDWTLARFTFWENRCFHDNDKQKSSKTVKLKFFTIQISIWKANTNILNCGVWQTKYTRTKQVCMFVLK